MRLLTGAGTVNLYVRNSLTWSGRVVGDGTRFVVGGLANTAVTLQGSFSGTALVPGGTLTLAANGTYEGAFYAKTMSVGANATLKKLATPFLIDGISASKTTVCVGEQIEVNLAGATTVPGTTASISGTAGAHQFLQFSGAPGPRLVSATLVSQDGHADFVELPLTLMKCAVPVGAAAPVALHYAGSRLGGTDRVEFSVRGYDENGHEVAPASPATYTWSFGDGKTETTTTPIVDHDYVDAVNPFAQFNYFTASVTMTTAAGSTTAQRVVALWNLYAFNRTKGVVQAPMQAAIHQGAYTAVIANREPTPLQLSSTRIDLAPCDPAETLKRQSVHAIAVTVPAGGKATVSIAPPDDIASTICGINIHVFGSTAAGSVFGSSYVTIRENPFLRHPVTDAPTIAVLNQASRLTRDPNSFNQLELAQLTAAGKLPELPPRAPAAGVYANPGVGDECTPGDISADGLACQPVDGDEWLGIEAVVLNANRGEIMMEHGCGTIGKLIHAIHQLYSHEAMFATRGRLVRHSTGAADYVQQGLDIAGRQIDDAHERYVFPGTSDADTYTIDQISGTYFLKNPDGGDDLKFGSELSLNPSVCHDEDFAAVPPVVVRPPPNADASIGTALARMTERGGEACTTNDDCPSGSCNVGTSVCNPGAMFAISSHYRFDMYSHAETTLSGPTSGYGVGTESTVSSTFMHLIPSRAGLPLRKSYKSPDGVSVVDGMRPYDAELRKAGANELYDDNYNKIREVCRPLDGGGAAVGGYLGSLLGGPEVIIAAEVLGTISAEEFCAQLADNIANQTNNCFARDDCGNLSDDWKDPGSGVTVSPDDILLWDLPNPVEPGHPENGLLGTYGYNEPLFYAPAVFRRRYRWALPAGASSIQVQVLNGKVVNGEPQPFTGALGARISLNGIQRGNTDSSGFAPSASTHYSAASGSYDVQAEWSACGNFGPAPTVPPPQSVNPFTLPSCAEAGPHLLCRFPECSQDNFLNTVTCATDCTEYSQCSVENPSGFRSDGSACPSCDVECACAVYQPPACATQLLTASKPLSIGAGESKTVTLTLCEGEVQTVFDPCADDVQCRSGFTCNPATHYCESKQECVQTCKDDSECFGVLFCEYGLCHPRPLVVDVFARLSYNVPVIDGESANISVFGEPFPVQCDGDATTPSPPVERDVCIQHDDEDVATLVFKTVCSRSSNGAITFQSELSIDEGCGSNREGHPRTHSSFTNPLAPIPDQLATHTYVGCYGNDGDLGCNDPDADIVVGAQVDFTTAKRP